MSTLTGNSRQRDQQIQLLLQNRIAQRYERRISREIRRVMKRSATLLTNGQPYGHLFNEHKNRISELLRGLYAETAEVFAEYFAGNEKMVRWALIQKREVPKTQIVARIVGDWVEQYGGELITEISNTTMEQINDIVAGGIADGLSEREIGKLITAVAPTKSASRAQTIARTESSRAANATGLETAKETGLEMQKVWNASGGSRTRDSHQRADNQKVGLDEFFIVGGERLRYPSDPSGSAAETINCRCVLTYEFL